MMLHFKALLVNEKHIQVHIKQKNSFCLNICPLEKNKSLFRINLMVHFTDLCKQIECVSLSTCIPKLSFRTLKPCKPFSESQAYFVQYEAIQTKTNSKSCSIYYLDHVQVLHPVGPHNYNSVSPFTSASSDRQAVFLFKTDSKESWLKCKINRSERRQTSFFIPMLFLLLFQESLVDF